MILDIYVASTIQTPTKAYMLKIECSKKAFLQQVKTADIPFAGGATIFLDTGTGTFSLGTAFLWTSGTLEEWARWEGRWERIYKCNIYNFPLHNVFYCVNTNNNFQSMRQQSSLWEDTTYVNMYKTVRQT